jgi:hypothetical protein
MAPENINDVINQTSRLEGLLTQFYGFLFLGILGAGIFLPKQWPASSRNENILGPVTAVVGFILLIWLSITTNLRIIHADIAFKMAEPFANNRQWSVANTIYRRAIKLSPDEDYYYLFLGRGSLEEAKTLTDPAEKQASFETAEADLIKAQSINPLNPDHTANLARLHSWWALQTPDGAEREKRGQVSDEYYSRVLILSPNNARLWDEWAILHLNVLNNSEKAFEILQHSLDLDPKYDWTHALLGDYYSKSAQNVENKVERTALYNKAVEHYQEAITYSPKTTNYYFALANAYHS